MLKNQFLKTMGFSSLVHRYGFYPLEYLLKSVYQIFECHLFLLLLSLIPLSIWNVSAIEVEYPAGVDRHLNADDFFRHSNKTNRYDELWFYAFVFDSGEKAYVSFSIMNPPLIEGKCGADISIFNFEGKNYSVARGFLQSELREYRSRNTIKIADSFFMKSLPGSSHRIHYETAKNEGYILDMEFTTAIAGKVRGDGIFRLGKTRYAQYIHIPYGKVTGSLKIGNVSKSVTGYGYMEHSWQNVMVSKLASHSIQLLNSGSMPIGRTIIGSKSYSAKPFGYSLDISSGVAKVVFPKTVRGDDGILTHGASAPGKYHINWDAPSLAPSVVYRNDQQKYSALSTIDGFLKKKVAKIAMGGEIVFLRGQIDAKAGNIDYNIMAIE